MLAVKEAAIESSRVIDPVTLVSLNISLGDSDGVVRSSRTYDLFKQGFDVLGALALLIATAPLTIFAAMAIKITSPGPIIFRQDRLTKGGKHFSLLKFRTMVANAETGTGAIWAQQNDPRVTRLGRFLRRTRIDELPQLFNVLSGDMSLIGPRPERPEFSDKLAEQFPSFNKRLEVKAGITGLAQVGSGYASCLSSYRKKLALDLLYIQNRCLLLDLKITLKTILVILTGSGAR